MNGVRQVAYRIFRNIGGLGVGFGFGVIAFCRAATAARPVVLIVNDLTGREGCGGGLRGKNPQFYCTSYPLAGN